MKIDRALRAEIVGACTKVMSEFWQVHNEECVSGEELGKRISIFTKSWLKEYGSTLPRTRAKVTSADGSEHLSAWTYPLHKIQSMLWNGEIKNLKLNKNENNG